MDYLVEFVESGGARIIKDPLLIDRKKDSPNVLLNPDIKHLRGVSPSFWIREGDTIVARSSEETKRLVLESIDEVHPFETATDAPFSQSSRFIAKIEEIDARQDNQIKHLSSKIMFHHDDMYSKLRELKLELDMKDHLHEAQIKSMKKIGAVLYFSCILAMLLLKFF